MEVRDAMKLDFGKPSKRQDGQIGARAKVRCEGAHPKTYAFDTHGMNSSEVAAKAREMSDYHDAKMARLADLADVRGHEFTVGDDVFRVVDCTIFDQAVTLYLDVRKIEQDGRMTQVHGFPIHKRCRSIDGIPSNAVIIQMMRDVLPNEESVQSAHEEFVQKVHDKMKAKA